MTQYMEKLQFYIDYKVYEILSKNASIDVIRINLEDLENKLYNMTLNYEQGRYSKFFFINVAKLQVTNFNKNFDLIVNLNKQIADMYKDKGENKEAENIEKELESLRTEVNKAVDKRFEMCVDLTKKEM